MTEKLAFKSFKSTGIWPKDPDIILRQFDNKGQEEAGEALRLTSSNWR
jgi:hypothetical protein